MNSHKKTDSDPIKFAIKEVLPIYLEDFIKDFSFIDIYPNINRYHFIFEDEECNQILSQPDDKQQIILMFFILTEKNKNIEHFLDVLQYDYAWLKKAILKGRDDYISGGKQMVRYFDAIYELRSIYPKHSDCNVHRLKYFCQIRDYLKKLKSRCFLVLYGELGVGKKWLTLDVCCDYSVLQSMGFNIFWIDVHDCDTQEKDLEKLQRLKILLGDVSSQKKIGDYEGISNKILELQQDLRTILKQDEFKDCLLVLSDVQNFKTVEAFNLPCKILITTRNKNIMQLLPKAKTYNITLSDGLSHRESFDLFEKILETRDINFPKNANDLFEYSKGNPFLLTIIAQNLKGRSKNEWNTWIRSLEDVEIQNDKINTFIRLSLCVLREDELDMYKTLAIFWHSVKIPVKVLAAYWGISMEGAILVVKKLDKFSLVTINTLKCGEMQCTLHDLYVSYLKNCNNINYEVLNRQLVESYNIDKAFEQRTQLDLVQLPDDNYFHYYIGYHLKHAQMMYLFPKLYLDFGFLDQKLRATGLPNTIGDLKYFRSEITGNDNYKEQFVDRLLDFLPNIEEMIFKSKDTSLLQYALMSTGLLQLEALKQAGKFPERIWFSDGDHFHRRRQMVPLREKPRILRLIEPDTCLIAMENNKIFLADLSFDYCVEPTYFVDHFNKIIALKIFFQNFFISLDNVGNLFVWTMADERRRGIAVKENRRLIANQIDYSTCPKIRSKKSIQLIKQVLNGKDLSIKAYYLDTINRDSVHLYVALSNGDINVYNWNTKIEKFDIDHTPTLNTKIMNILFIFRVLNNIMVINNSGSIAFYNLRDGSQVCFGFKWPHVENLINVHMTHRQENTILIFVFAQKVLQLKIPERQIFDFLQMDLEDLFEVNDRKSQITCSALSEDNKYLIIGTKQGILVYDAVEKSDVLRNSISETITCVDICQLDDEIYKYVIVSGSVGQKVLNIFGLKLNENDSITWANSIGTFVNENHFNLSFEPNAWLIGKKLFDIAYYPDVESLSLVAVDSKYRIHHLINNKFSMMLSEKIVSKITAVTAVRDEYYIGCENGDVYKSTMEVLEMNLSNPIIFLNVIGNDYLVASTKDKCIVKDMKKNHTFDFGAIKCWMYEEKYLIFIDKDCSLMVLNTLDNFKIIETTSKLGQLAGCDLVSNYLMIGTQQSFIFVYTIIDDQTGFAFSRHYKQKLNPEETITCLAIFNDKSICAIGFESGLIEIYKICETWKLIQTLKSHRSGVRDLKFSPWESYSLPIILASISEQICFWNITHVLNNPLDNINGSRRHSSRFSSKKKIDRSDALNESILSDTSLNDSSTLLDSIWSNKKGSSQKPELLACIKFAGNRAEKFYTNNDFTKFITIDDEGEVYMLSVRDIEQQNGQHHNGHCIDDKTFVDGDNDVDDDDVII